MQFKSWQISQGYNGNILQHFTEYVLDEKQIRSLIQIPSKFVLKA